ncbi:E3 ubiquitin-protein ligase [Capsicum annuum]|uniref:RING-type E3 ubiquitin transferase n=1 Tax=Capsicum annuum TaxID=4072 RepID=A0A1U8GX66_CAPAN|nr:E3 ubiquitin-protein ligase [Capsicum annuum]
MSSYWCYRCTRFVRISAGNDVVCPHCDSGFIEFAEGNIAGSPESRRRFPDRSSVNMGSRRSRRNNRGDRSPFNPVIVLRSPSEAARGGEDEAVAAAAEERSYELYYDDGEGSGLRPLPPTMSEFLMGSGFDRLLDQLAHIEVNGFGRPENPPASKSAIESMPIVQISSNHVNSETHCAVCKEAFELGSEAREMPCEHIYHSDCILPWLSLRNSCPVCRHELPSESTENANSDSLARGRNEEEAMGLTIWRLPGGGFAVGRFSGGRRGAERELPVVYTEMDGGFNNGVPRRIAWRSRRSNTGRNGSGISRIFSNFASFFRRLTPSNQRRSLSIHSSSSDSSGSGSGSAVFRSRSVSNTSIFSRYLRRSRRNWAPEESNGVTRW